MNIFSWIVYCGLGTLDVESLVVTWLVFISLTGG